MTAEGGSIADESTINPQSAILNPRCWFRWGGSGLRHRRSPIVGRRILHVEEKRAGPPASGELTLPLLGVLPSFLAILAPDRERQGTKPLLRNFLAAIEAVSVVALLEPHQRVVDFVERFRLHLDQGELEIFLDVGLSALDRVEHLVQLAAPRPLFPDSAHFALNFGLNFTAPAVEHLLEFGIAGLGHSVFRRRSLVVLHTPLLPTASRIARRYANELPIIY